MGGASSATGSARSFGAAAWPRALAEFVEISRGPLHGGWQEATSARSACSKCDFVAVGSPHRARRDLRPAGRGGPLRARRPLAIAEAGRRKARRREARAARPRASSRARLNPRWIGPRLYVQIQKTAIRTTRRRPSPSSSRDERGTSSRPASRRPDPGAIAIGWVLGNGRVEQARQNRALVETVTLLR